MRPRKCRRLCFCPKVSFYKPAGIAMRELREIALGPDELEVIKFIDVDGLDQNETGRKLGVSRITIQRIYKSARGKIATAITQGKALRLTDQVRGCGCRRCENNIVRKRGE